MVEKEEDKKLTTVPGENNEEPNDEKIMSDFMDVKALSNTAQGMEELMKYQETHRELIEKALMIEEEDQMSEAANIMGKMLQ